MGDKYERATRAIQAEAIRTRILGPSLFLTQAPKKP